MDEHRHGSGFRGVGIVLMLLALPGLFLGSRRLLAVVLLLVGGFVWLIGYAREKQKQRAAADREQEVNPAAAEGVADRTERER